MNPQRFFSHERETRVGEMEKEGGQKVWFGENRSFG